MIASIILSTLNSIKPHSSPHALALAMHTTATGLFATATTFLNRPNDVSPRANDEKK